VRTPLLIAHGEDDSSVELADQVFVGLRRLGREVEYRRYAHEGHVMSGRGNVIDFWNALIRWFDRYVKNPRSAP
jgi:dipeptidyl aminopeptidase/acylaminoacyl peptidase